jgi:hypothetical protein
MWKLGLKPSNPFLWVHKWDFPCSALIGVIVVCRFTIRPSCTQSNSVSLSHILSHTATLKYFHTLSTIRRERTQRLLLINYWIWGDCPFSFLQYMYIFHEDHGEIWRKYTVVFAWIVAEPANVISTWEGLCLVLCLSKSVGKVFWFILPNLTISYIYSTLPCCLCIPPSSILSVGRVFFL